MFWLLACGPVNTAIDTPDIAVSSHVILGAGLLMVLQGPASAFFLRGSGTPFWRRKLVLVPLVLGLAALAALILIVNLSGPSLTSDPTASQLTLLSVLVGFTAAILLFVGVLYVLAEAPRLLPRRQLAELPSAPDGHVPPVS